MWIFLNDAFLSIVRHNSKPEMMMVRGRIEGDIARAFPGTQEIRTPEADYLVRAEIAADEVARALAASVLAIDYPNFKGSVRERHRHDAYMGVWTAMNSYQKRQKASAMKSDREKGKPSDEVLKRYQNLSD